MYADPRLVRDPKAAAVAAGKALDLDPDELYPLLSDRSTRFVYVLRKADPLKAAQLERQKIPGFGFYVEELRAYPQGGVGAHVLGYGGVDNRGLEGLERSLDKTLAGRPGSETIVRDLFGRAIEIVASRPERPGRNVKLTIDHQIQASAEDVLGQTVRSWGAKGATAVVLDVRTGAVLAMANAPAFDANRSLQPSAGAIARSRMSTSRGRRSSSSRSRPRSRTVS